MFQPRDDAGSPAVVVRRHCQVRRAACGAADAPTVQVKAEIGGSSQFTIVPCGPACAITADFRLLRRVREWLDGPSAMPARHRFTSGMPRSPLNSSGTTYDFARQCAPFSRPTLRETPDQSGDSAVRSSCDPYVTVTNCADLQRCLDRLDPWIASSGAGGFVSAPAVERAGEGTTFCFMTESILD